MKIKCKTIDNLDVYPHVLVSLNWYEATKACEELGDGWRLPTKDELNLMYVSKEFLGDITTGCYWSSSEVEECDAWDQSFANGHQYHNDKTCENDVRPVRDTSKETTRSDDIVSGLRDAAFVHQDRHGRQWMMEAADEIERLRAEITKLSQWKYSRNLVNDTTGELVRFREESQNLKAAIERVSELHRNGGNEPEFHCDACFQEYPCLTIQALEGESE